MRDAERASIALIQCRYCREVCVFQLVEVGLVELKYVGICSGAAEEQLASEAGERRRVLGLGLLKVTRYKTFKPLKSPLQLEVDPI